jgi:hypothetical protein
MKKIIPNQGLLNTKVFLKKLFIINSKEEVRMCNYVDNYYGDQQCFVMKRK